MNIELTEAVARKVLKPYERLGQTVGRTRSPTYMAWQGMRARCSNPNRPDYQFYGGRGISVSVRWQMSFATFLSDMGERPHGTSLDRINNALGYAPGNCRWATKHEQMQNTRGTRLITLGGETLGLNEWARRLGVTHSSIQGRLRRGWSVERALTQPKRKENR